MTSHPSRFACTPVPTALYISPGLGPAGVSRPPITIPSWGKQSLAHAATGSSHHLAALGVGKWREGRWGVGKSTSWCTLQISPDLAHLEG